MTSGVEHEPGEINHREWLVCPGCGFRFEVLNGYDFVGQLRAAGWDVDWTRGGWWCRKCRHAAANGQKVLL